MTILSHMKHRPWPLPKAPWIMKQTWHSLLFAHWPIHADLLKALLPKELELDTFEGTAWLGVVPFGMSRIRLRGFPSVPYTSSFPEINVRTYVTYNNKPGVYFFSLDAANLLAVKAARRFFHLPYYHAAMKLERKGETISYSSERIHKHTLQAHFAGKYKPISHVFYAEKDTIEHWLTERYALYTVYKGKVYCGDIHHKQWPLQHAEAEMKSNTMAQASGFTLPNIKPILHYAGHLDVLIWSLKNVTLA